jgi:hypothetical protein
MAVQSRPAPPRAAPARANGAGSASRSAKSRSNGKATNGGFAYDLVSGGPDGRDAEFERL